MEADLRFARARYKAGLLGGIRDLTTRCDALGRQLLSASPDKLVGARQRFVPSLSSKREVGPTDPGLRTLADCMMEADEGVCCFHA